jgi:transcriptional regulator with XRE-family HTH domain
LLVETRKGAGQTQTQVASRLKRHQSYIAKIETGQRRLDVVEFPDLADATGFGPAAMIRTLRDTDG